MNLDSTQEGNQTIHMYFGDRRKKKRRKQPLNFKFIIIIMQIIKQRLSEALSPNVFSGLNYLDSVRNCVMDNTKLKFGIICIVLLSSNLSVLTC
jgi:hypothetical protein